MFPMAQIVVPSCKGRVSTAVLGKLLTSLPEIEVAEFHLATLSSELVADLRKIRQHARIKIFGESKADLKF
jgi:hypothetical protein